VKTATVYTYVTRGHLTPHRKAGDRSSWFERRELDAVISRTGRRSAARGAARETVTAISLIADGSYWYRGHDAEELAASTSYEAVAELLWTGKLPKAVDWRVPSLTRTESDSRGLDLSGIDRPLDAIRLAMSVQAANDDLRFGVGGEALNLAARHLLVGMVAMLPVRSPIASWSISGPVADSFAGLVWSRLSDTAPSEAQIAALNATLIVMADHGVAPSTLAVRTAASYRADLYGAVQSGLAIVAGGWHGGRALSAESMIEDFLRGRDVAAVVGEHARQGRVPALGQPRYPDGDPRVGIVLRHLAAAGVEQQILDVMDELIALTRARALPAPSVEFALAAMARGFSFQRGASEALFAIGRCAGWLAHAMEEFGEPGPTSPQFRYVGVSPLDRS
jgi:citrate synthase